MRLCLALVAVATVCPNLVHAQVDLNLFRKWDQTTEFTDRGSNGGNAGFISQGFPYGILAGQTTLTRVRYVAQDFNVNTAEPFHLLIVKLNSAGLPDYANARTIAANITLPQSPPGNQAYTVTHTFNGVSPNPAPVPITVPDDQFHIGWQFTRSTSWPTDGLGIHTSWAGALGTGFSGTPLMCMTNTFNNSIAHQEIPRRENSVLIDPELAWSTGSNNTTVPTDQSWRLDLGFAGPVLNCGSSNTTYNGNTNAGACPNPNTGYASLDPDFRDIGGHTPGRFDNPTWFVEGGSAFASGFAVMFMSTSVLPVPIKTPFGDLLINLADPLAALGPVPIGVLDGSGAGSLTFNMGPNNSPVRAVAVSLPMWSAQALLLKGSTAKLSNLYTMRPQLKPAGFKSGQATNTAPITMARTPTDKSIYVRNDGRGALFVIQKVGSNPFGPATKVPEFTGVNITLAPPVTSVEITTKTSATKVTYRFGFF